MQVFSPSDVIDEKYRVLNFCSDDGGMGTLLHVAPIHRTVDCDVVLKYCKSTDARVLKRFRREVRLLSAFATNPRVVAVLDRNIDFAPPYYVMKFYADGDLTSLQQQLQGNELLQERVFCQMIDCVAELHARDVYHRDIKPQNFLRDGEHVLISDLGLSMEAESRTAFTSTTESWGTIGYLPPEFTAGGFKLADAASDVFMLGKSYFALLTGQEPLYLIQGNIPGPLFRVIQKSCTVDKTQRYKSLSELRTALTAAYDVMLKRAADGTALRNILKLISANTRGAPGSLDDLLSENPTTDVGNVCALGEFFDELARLDETDQIRMCRELDRGFFRTLCRSQYRDRISELLDVYRVMVEKDDYNWPFAENIANNMAVLFDHPAVIPEAKANGLDLAIIAADRMNRFAAMDTCRDIVVTIDDNETALAVCEVLAKHRDSFIGATDPAVCKNALIRRHLSKSPSSSAIT
jgi:serine/threonine protein kinase